MPKAELKPFLKIIEVEKEEDISGYNNWTPGIPPVNGIIVGILFVVPGEEPSTFFRLLEETNYVKLSSSSASVFLDPEGVEGFEDAKILVGGNEYFIDQFVISYLPLGVTSNMFIAMDRYNKIKSGRPDNETYSVRGAEIVAVFDIALIGDLWEKINQTGVLDRISLQRFVRTEEGLAYFGIWSGLIVLTNSGLSKSSPQDFINFLNRKLNPLPLYDSIYNIVKTLGTTYDTWKNGNSTFTNINAPLAFNNVIPGWHEASLHAGEDCGVTFDINSSVWTFPAGSGIWRGRFVYNLKDLLMYEGDGLIVNEVPVVLDGNGYVIFSVRDKNWNEIINDAPWGFSASPYYQYGLTGEFTLDARTEEKSAMPIITALYGGVTVRALDAGGDGASTRMTFTKIG